MVNFDLSKRPLFCFLFLWFAGKKRLARLHQPLTPARYPCYSGRDRYYLFRSDPSRKDLDSAFANFNQADVLLREWQIRYETDEKEKDLRWKAANLQLLVKQAQLQRKRSKSF